MGSGTAVTLPGGAVIGGRLVRDAAFRPLTGRLEQQLAAVAGDPRPAGSAPVTDVLALALADVGGAAPTTEVVAALSVPDRQFLMLALALEWGDDQQWRHVTCGHCGGLFDVGYRISELPLKPAGPGYPWTRIVLGGRDVCLRVPTGLDEERLAGLAPPDARRALALACVVSLDDAPPEPQLLEGFGDADIDAIDAALDETAPQLASELRVECAECGTAQTLGLDAGRRVAVDAVQLLRDVHTLASHYHWSEAEILRLTRARRRFYLDLIDQVHEHGH